MSLVVTAMAATAMLGGCKGARQSATAPTTASTRNDDVFPTILDGSQSLELGELILLLMPDRESTAINWDFRAVSPIKWQAEPYTLVPETGYASRTGWVRVNVQGRTASILRDHKMELGWTVQYSNSRGDSSSKTTFPPPQSGVSAIEIKAGGEGDLACFGSAFEGCKMEEPLTSLVKAGIAVDTICSQPKADGHVSAFLLTHPGHRPTVMIWETSGGSGGESSWIMLDLGATRNASGSVSGTADPGLHDAKLCGR